jgi:phosphoglycerol transferase MdoB-like AlkP superfamily enzyme
MIRTLKVFISLLIIFALHRHYAWTFLAQQYGERNVPLWREVLVGCLSDIWVAGILCLPLWFMEYFPTKLVIRWHRRLALFLIFLVGALTAGHQSYVEFFRFQIIPFHVGYLADTSFLKSNSGSVFNPASSIILMATAGLSYWARNAKHIVSKRPIHVMLVTFALTIVACHVLNIRWRVNWYVIEPIQMNYVEALYSNLTKKPSLKAISEDERQLFSKMTGQNNSLRPDILKAAGNDPSVMALRAAVKARNRRNKPVILAVLVAESLRASDVGPRGMDGATLTPTLDRLQELGTRFSNVYSTGPVTRGGQEAVWCGTPSATDTSMMRSFPDLAVSCLPKAFRDRPEMVSLWAHGGDERFDSQLMFWTHQGVNRFLTRSDFLDDTPSTSWGVGDLALFTKAADMLAELAAADGVKTVLSMILSVTNHIPWALPDDASIEAKRLTAQHPSQRTIMYFDDSIDMFVDSLKEKNLWDDTVLIITGDHGNLEPSWRDDYPSDPLKWERLLSHVSVTLTGGIVEQLRREGQLPTEVSTVSSQSQIAGLLQILATASDARQALSPPWDAPLFIESPWVVTSDLNQYLFLPAESVRIAKEDVLSGKITPDQPRQWQAAFRYRDWLEFLYSKKSSH